MTTLLPYLNSAIMVVSFLGLSVDFGCHHVTLLADMITTDGLPTFCMMLAITHDMMWVQLIVL